MTRFAKLQLLVVCAGLLAADRAWAEMDELPLLRDNKSLVFTYLGAPLIDSRFPPTSSLPYSRPFKVIQVGMQMGPDQDRLLEVARDVLVARLHELGASDQFVVLAAHEGRPGSWPAETTRCDVLELTFAINMASEEADGEKYTALAGVLYATQGAIDNEGNCANSGALQPEAMTSWPRASVVRRATDDRTFAQAQRMIVDLIDQEIVSKVIATNDVARATAESWLKAPK